VKTEPDRKVLLGRYELGEIIGVGGMGEVRAARDLTLDRPVAIKFLRTHIAPSAEMKARFNSEAKAAAQLSHPNIVGVLDSGEDAGTPFIVMERLSGRTLADRIAESPLPEWEARLRTLEILAALEASHDQGILHRDLKPGNVLLTDRGVAKVADFGIAKIAEGTNLTTSGITLGTPAYLAPERVAGLPATPASDVYSAGVVLYEMLTAKKPFHADTPLGMIRAIQEEDPEPLDHVRPDVDPVLASIVERTLTKDPRRRYDSAVTMREALEQWVPKSEADATGSLTGSPTGGLLVPRKGSSPRMRRLAGILIAILAIAWPAYLLMSIQRAEPGATSTKAPTPAPSPSPTVPVDPAFQASLAQLEAAVAASGRSRDLEAPVAKIRSAAQIGDRLGVSEQLVVIRNKVESLLQEGDLQQAEAESLLAAVFGVELQLGKVVPPIPLNPSPSPLS
jgi:serine/threonine protein kinase